MDCLKKVSNSLGQSIAAPFSLMGYLTSKL